MISDVIKDIRRRNYLNQTAFANKLGVTQGTVSQWENGLTRPNLDQLRSISSIFGVSIDSLLNTQAPVYTEIRRSAIPILGSIACGERIAPDLNPGGYADLPEGVRAEGCADIPPFNRRVIGSSPTWGAFETAENERSAVSLFIYQQEKTEKKNPV